jgi:rhodanese-related sulfurtransferase
MEKSTNTDCLPPGEVRRRQQSGENIQIIDVRSPDEFSEGHVPNSVNLPLAKLEAAAAGLDKSTLFVTVCGKGGGRSTEGANKLQSLGLQAVWLCGGTFGWLGEN